ncbi:hypothetical protein [Streptomyces sp. NL15-2K]|uniref:hypothetical protein n=1 Tax=Streptomyces sp. NL15-2K TaxID=376149 RepID=UPI000F565488|nr:MULTISPECIES: hypothetical protein [Actinomycetes]WKX07436.1 hypothetical protein Q4V64_08010 [Kutzneria buriramensis]GCB51331.1 hypothetical protein SNL152K_8687 [Streptomyces sp. NL15-2K]
MKVWKVWCHRRVRRWHRRYPSYAFRKAYDDLHAVITHEATLVLDTLRVFPWDPPYRPLVVRRAVLLTLYEHQTRSAQDKADAPVTPFAVGPQSSYRACVLVAAQHPFRPFLPSRRLRHLEEARRTVRAQRRRPRTLGWPRRSGPRWNAENARWEQDQRQREYQETATVPQSAQQQWEQAYPRDIALLRRARPDDPASGDHHAQLELGRRLLARGHTQDGRYWLRWAAIAGYHDGRSPYES